MARAWTIGQGLRNGDHLAAARAFPTLLAFLAVSLLSTPVTAVGAAEAAVHVVKNVVSAAPLVALVVERRRIRTGLWSGRPRDRRGGPAA